MVQNDTQSHHVPGLIVRCAVLGVCSLVVYVVGMMVIDFGYPGVISTYSLLVTTLFFWAGFSMLGMLSLPAVFLGFLFPQLLGAPGHSRILNWAFLTLLLFSIYCFTTGWEDGLQYHGEDKVKYWLFVNLGAIAFIAIGLFISTVRTSWFVTVGLKSLIFIWATCLAFPYFGDLSQ